MPESKSEHVRHSNEEVSNFLACGDARGPGWLAAHPTDRDAALGLLQRRPGMSVEAILASAPRSVVP
ncbi:hypothetical protein ABIB25_004131 [Nakamurella sp. UYEF19]|uniref:hypothetical protein n=1 Tax=Nakamurella sp. UYEF19 TaxID=1756392 RepID=UPI0033936153